jgi:hypothetical protein
MVSIETIPGTGGEGMKENGGMYPHWIKGDYCSR